MRGLEGRWPGIAMKLNALATIAYRGAPNDGSAWTKGDCSLRVLREGRSRTRRPPYAPRRAFVTIRTFGTTLTSDARAANGADPVICRRETAELNRIRATPDLVDAKHFASAVTCDAVKPQAARLLESLKE